jgi:predicted PurR-regulated permease PerM
LVIGGLLWGAGIVILNQSQSVYNLIANNGNTLSFLNSANNSIAKALPAGISFNLNQKISDFISFITNNIAGIFTFTLSTLLYFLLTSLSIFYILKDSAHWKKAIKLISPLSDKDNDKIIDKLSLAVNGVMKGYFSIVFIQGALVSLGFVLFKVPNPALWGLMAFIASFVPAIGSALVSIPIVIFLFVTGHSIEAVGLALWALAMVGTIDILLNPIIVGKKANLHPMLILFSVLGGISLLGPIGLIVGPLVVSLFYTLVSIYRDEFKQESVIS